MRSHWLGVAWAVVLVAGCGSKKEGLAEQKLAQAQAKSASAKKAAAEAAAPAPAVKLDAFWDDPAYVRIQHDQKCPAGLEALFGGGAGAAPLKSATFVAQLRGPSQVKLGEYDQAKGSFQVEVLGVVFCHTPDDKLISFALGTKPTAYIPGDREVGEHYWQPVPLFYEVPVPFSDMKAFKEKNLLGLDARFVFKPGRTEVHKMLKKIEETAEEAAERKKYDIPKAAGGVEDWGAGRLVHAQVQGVRLGGDQSRTTLLEKRGGK